ncbi:uncharacterized protein LOC133724373 [Rosa rugosa]|uniref:uncharacterized protein LOC133724373 n=1 Tax=Rosa rugosa TaxID=74645 RepID=UPI002B40483C|nr:uncharacterized protein LOC133724373 [Rosa rugosa]
MIKSSLKPKLVPTYLSGQLPTPKSTTNPSLPVLPGLDWRITGSHTPVLSLSLCAPFFSLFSLIFSPSCFSLCLFDHDPTVKNERSLRRCFLEVSDPQTLRSHFLVSGCRKMETNYGSVGVNGASLTRAVEALAALLLSALLRTQLLALDPLAFLPNNGAGIKEDPHTTSQAKPADAEGDDEDDDGDGGLEEGEEDLSSEEGEEYGNKPNNNKSNSKKAPEGGAGGGAEENGEEEEGDEEDGDDQEDDNEDDNDEEDDDDDDDDDNDDGGEEDEEGVEEENEEEEEDEDEEALQPPKKRKK